MSLAEALATSRPPLTTGPRCTIAALLDRLGPDDRAALLAALDDPDTPGSWLARVLTGQGHRVQGNTIQRHRRRDCTCG